MKMLKQGLRYIRAYKFNSLFLRNMIIIFLAIACPTVFLHTLMYSFSKNDALEYAYSTNNELCSTMRDVTDAVIDEMRSLAILTSINPRVNHMMLFPGANTGVEEDFIDYIGNFINIYDYLSSMYLYCETNQKIISRDAEIKSLSEMEDQAWYEVYKNAPNDDLIIYFRAYRDFYPYYLTFIKPVYVTPTHNVGAVVLNVDIERLYDSYIRRSRVTPHEFMVADQDGQIIYDTDRKKISTLVSENEMSLAYSQLDSMTTGTIEHNGDRFVVSRLRSESYDWDYYCAMPMDFYSAGLAKMVMTLLIMVAVSLVISVVISAYISKKIFTPIENIIETLDDPAPWIKLETETNKNETDYILSKIASEKRANQTLLDEQGKKVIILKRLQTLMLQLQINPHFLGNTLNAINWLAVELTMGENKASQAITKLARMFKEYSDTTDYMTDLKNEIEYTKQYIDILSLRYPEAFSVEWQIDELSQKAKIPRFTLQPLIENAVYYGIIPMNKEGVVTICAKMESSILTISVTDNGVGMSEEKMQNLNREFLSDYVFFDGHIGLKNVNQRVKLIYGETYGLHLESSATGGVRVVLRLPFVTLRNDEQAK
ncbi:MAG: sensor histidine kinase [Clostridia bacterium]